MSPIGSDALDQAVDPSAKLGEWSSEGEHSKGGARCLLVLLKGGFFRKKPMWCFCFLCAVIPAADLLLFTFHPNLYNVDLDV